MSSLLIYILFSFINILPDTNTSSMIHGAWKSNDGVVIFSGNYFTQTVYSTTEFNYTAGGSFKIDGQKMILTYEFHTQESEKVGTSATAAIDVNGESMIFEGDEFKKLDDGAPGMLEGAWLFFNRKRNGELGNPRTADNPRKTMKILSGTRFQWIAYNVDTKEFMGTGGGTYTTIEGKYTENIDFFSRDQSRVGASLEFDFERKGDEWHHQGLSSKGDPIYEIWKLRE